MGSLGSVTPVFIGAAPAMLVGMTIGFALVAALIAGLWRGRLPAGVGAGVFVTAIVGAALLALAIDPNGGINNASAGRTLACLAVIWYALSRVDARRVSSSSVGDNADTSGPAVLGAAALACGIGALVNCLTTPEGLGSAAGWSPAATDYLLLLLLATAAAAFRTGGWAPYPAVALLACLLSRAADAASWRSWTIPTISAIALASVLVMILLDWDRRRRAWLANPKPTPKTAPRGSELFGPIAALSILIGVVALGRAESTWTVVAIFLCALTCLVAGHARGWPWAGECGLALIALGIVAACMAWIAPGWAGALVGIPIAGAYLRWMAGFWSQQLDDGRAWTTAGKLIPAARRLGVAASVAALATAGVLTTSAAFEGISTSLAAVMLALLLLVARFFYRGDEPHRAGDALAVCCWLMAAAAPATQLLSTAFDMPMSPIVAFSAGTTLLALSVFARAPSGTARGLFGAYLGGVMPICALFTIAWRGLDSQATATLILTLATLATAAMSLRRKHDRSSAVAVE